MSKFAFILAMSYPCFANNNDAFVPEQWAQESLMILEANMVAGNLVHRDFSDQVASFGDVVNTRRPATFTAARKVDDDDVTVQDATATNVPVALNQHLHTSFMIKDGEQSKSFKNLVTEYLYPAVLSLAEGVDQIVLAQQYRFLAYSASKLGTSASVAAITQLREVLTNNRCPMSGRNLIITPNVEGTLLGLEAFTSAEKIGDDGSALREGSLGRKFGFQIHTCQNASTIAAGNTTSAGAVNNGSGYAAGISTMAVDGITGALVTGSFFTVAGDMTPHYITAHGENTAGNTTSITFSPALQYAVANDAVVTVYTPGAVNLGAGYDAGYAKTLVVDDFSVAPKRGQIVNIGGVLYGAINTPTTTGLVLDRPLSAGAANDAVVGIGPAGEYCFGFHRNAISLVTRPLAAPQAGTGALSYVANFNGLGVRVTITYNGTKQGHLVTVDLLCGVEVLDTRLGALLYA